MSAGPAEADSEWAFPLELVVTKREARGSGLFVEILPTLMVCVQASTADDEEGHCLFVLRVSMVAAGGFALLYTVQVDSLRLMK